MRIEKKGKKKCHFTSVWSSSEIGRNRPFISEDCLNFGRLSPMLQISHLQTSLTERGDRHQAARRADINHHHARSLVSLDRLSLHKIKRIHEGSRVFFPRWSRSRIITSRCSVIKSDFKARTCNCQSLGAAAAPPPPHPPQLAADHFVSHQSYAPDIKATFKLRSDDYNEHDAMAAT